jgi:hypothetical protein
MMFVPAQYDQIDVVLAGHARDFRDWVAFANLDTGTGLRAEFLPGKVP